MVSLKICGITLLAALSSTVLAHRDLSGLSDDEIIARSHAAKARHLKARSCSSAIAAYNAQRKAKRALKLGKRQDASTTSEAGTGTTSSLAPSATAINNNTCVTAPEVTEGPYYINNEFVRQDLREGQEGISLTLDLGIMDTSTCTPLGDAFVEIWSTNATGYYAGFGTGSSTGGGGGGDGGMGNFTLTDSFAPTATGTDASMSAVPTGGMQGNDTTGGPGEGGGAGGGTSSAMPYNETFSRGGWTTNSEGIVEFLTTFPGYYTGRTIHIHMMVHTNYSVASNGTIISHSGSVAHIGQIFFEDSFADAIMNTTVYLQNTNTRMLNAADSIMQEESADGNDAIADASYIVDGDPTGGVYAYLTVGVDGTASHSIASTNYNLVSEPGSGSTSSSSNSSSSADNTSPNSASSDWAGKLSYLAGLLPLALAL